MAVTFSSGCDYNEIGHWVIIYNGDLEESRSIEEVRTLLNENPAFTTNYEKLKRLFSDYWWLIVTTPGFVS